MTDDKYVVLQAGEYRDEIGEVKAYGPFTEAGAVMFMKALMAQDERIGYQRVTRITPLRQQVPSDAEALGEDDG